MSSSQSFFSVDPHQANLQPHLLLFNSRLRFNPTSTLLGVTFDRTFFFSKHVSSPKAKLFPRLKASRYTLLPHGAPLKSPSLFCIKLFHFLALSILPNWNACTERPVAPSPAAYRSRLSHFSPLRRLCLSYGLP